MRTKRWRSRRGAVISLSPEISCGVPERCIPEVQRFSSRLGRRGLGRSRLGRACLVLVHGLSSIITATLLGKLAYLELRVDGLLASGLGAVARNQSR